MASSSLAEIRRVDFYDLHVQAAERTLILKFEEDNHDGDEDSVDGLRYLTTDLIIGLYIVACLAIDIFAILQLYDYYPTQIVAVVSAVLIIVFAVVQAWGFRIVRRLLMQ